LIRNEKNAANAADLRDRLENCKPCKKICIDVYDDIIIVPDDFIINIVKERLDKPDCRMNGWILDGCPSTPEQIQLLNQLGVSPSLVVTLDQSDSAVYEKIEQRRFDPVEGRYYNLLTDEVPDEVLSRLVHQKEHTHPIVKRRLQDYRNFLSTVENEYRKHLIRINAEECNSSTSENPDSANQVFMSLCDAVENIV
jgi:adenylate kinase